MTRRLLLGLAALWACAAHAAGPSVSQYYRISQVPTPPGVNPQVGGLAALPDGRLVACFHHGEVAFYDPKSSSWRIFAVGLHEPLGVLPEPDGSLLVMQRPELTRLRDTRGTGVADSYETVWDGFGMSGNYHEFGFGPVRGPDGKLYVSLNLASNGAPVRPEIRGPWSTLGLPRERFTQSDWMKVKGQAGRMYSRVAYRGWVVQIDEATGQAIPYACGFRSPDGIGFDAEGRLLVVDNQGDWRGTNEVHFVEPGGFYGHPASLVWREGWNEGDPLKLPVERLNELRTVPAIEIPYVTYSNSPTQPVVIPRTAAWGPYGGQLLVGEMNFPRLIRLLPEQVDGVWQGACVFLMEAPALWRGLHRLAFVGDRLYIGRIHLSWVGGEGICAVDPVGGTPFDPLDVHATPGGFKFSFTRPLSSQAADAGRWTVRRYRYAYHAAYGSPELNQSAVEVGKVELGEGGRTASVVVDDLRAGFIYDFDLSRIESVQGGTPLNPHIAYTLNRIPATWPATR